MGDWTEGDWTSAGQSMALYLAPGLTTSEHQWVWIALLLQLSGLGPTVQPGRESAVAGISLVSGGGGSLWQGCFVSMGPQDGSAHCLQLSLARVPHSSHGQSPRISCTAHSRVPGKKSSPANRCLDSQVSRSSGPAFVTLQALAVCMHA